ncbi:iron dicitrate transporter FecR [Echinicola pacifica]|uniref:Iron dicitrate transporter FecR n=1 Tax=Echinicola pacifica TaxID=346377 RepID=A0A918QBA7_9BACT|nr:FecR family protein [Echinicola pacifica]GGZ37584.1 iron dicitrate transporter FecR [Echinicola pacifica]
MNKNSEEIDFSIIWKKLHSSLNEEEEGQLSQWLASHSDHQDYYNKVKVFYEKGSKFENGTKNAGEAWAALEKKDDFRKPGRSNRIVFYAAAVAANLVLLCIAYFVFKPYLTEPKEVKALASQILPGTDRAILLTEEGSYDLSSGAPLALEEGGTAVRSQGNQIQYDEANGASGKVTFNTLLVPKGGQFNLILADGTKVWLNANSQLKYPTSFPGDSRVVELQGEAYFEVQEDARKPFKVLTGEQVVQVWGTSFNISSYEDEEAIATTLVEGKVEVFLTNSSAGHQMLSPNQQSLYHKNEASLESKTVDVHKYIAWKEGWFVFQDKPLVAIINSLARWYDFSFEFKNEETKSIPFTGKIRRYEDLQEVMDLLQKTGDVKFKLERRNMIIE